MNRRPSFLAVPAALGFLALSLAVEAPARAGDEPETREFADQNFKWTIPAKWSFVEPSDEDKAEGYVINAKRLVGPGVEVTAYVSVVDGAGASVETQFVTVKENKSKTLTDVKIEEDVFNWSGAAEGRRQKITGLASNKSRIAWFTYGGLVKDKYHQLSMRSSNGAYADVGAEMDQVVKGYVFLEGAVATDAEPRPDAAAGQKSFRFERLALTWTLPEKITAAEGVVAKQEPSPTMKLDAEPMLKDEFARVQLRIGDDTVGAMILRVQPEQIGGTVSAYIKTEDNFKGDAEQMEGTAIPEIDETVKVGNAQGGMRGTSGKSKENGKPLLIRKYFVVLNGALFVTVLISHDNAYQTYKEWFRGVLAGLHWDDASGGVRGPWGTPFPTFTAVRNKTDSNFKPGEKTTLSNSLLTLTKGPKWARVQYDATDGPYVSWSTALEARDDDAYCFIGVQKFPADQFQKQKKEFETLIEDHEAVWKNALDEPVTRTGKDTLRKQASFKGGKGWSYEFRGKKEGSPFVERGWVVKVGTNIVHVRIQYGGAAGEAKLKAEVDKLVGSLKFA